MRNLISTLLLITTCSLNAWSWGPNGHRIVGELGQRHLSKKAASRVMEITKGRPLSLLSTWADEIKSDPHWNFAKPWHYISVNDNQSLEEVLAFTNADPKIDNVMEAMALCTKVLQGDGESSRELERLMAENQAEPLFGSTEATALALLVHFIGDVHQPLHVGRKEDKGGNTIKVLWFYQSKNLHGVWDSELVEYDKLSFTDYADYIDFATEEELNSWQKDKMEAWAQESINERAGLYESTYTHMTEDGKQEGQKIPSLGYAYAYRNTAIVKKRLLQAGVRLAGVLNQAFE